MPEEFSDWRPPSSPQCNHQSDVYDSDIYDYSIPSTAGQSSVFGPTIITPSRLEYSVIGNQKFPSTVEYSGNIEYDSLKKSSYSDNGDTSGSPPGKRPKLQLYRYSSNSCWSLSHLWFEGFPPLNGVIHPWSVCIFLLRFSNRSPRPTDSHWIGHFLNFFSEIYCHQIWFHFI